MSLNAYFKKNCTYTTPKPERGLVVRAEKAAHSL